MRRLTAAFAALIMIILCGSAAALRWDETLGCYVDDSGNPARDVWDDNNGIYVDENGTAHQIDNTDGKPADNDETTPTGDGTPIVVTYPDNGNQTDGGNQGTQTDPDGGMVVGVDDTVSLPEPDAPAATMTPEEWQAREQRAAQRNGVTTGTVYTDGQGNVHPASIDYIGLGRSMITVDGKQMLVPTSDLSWDTEASEAKRLAVVSAPKQGSAKMRAKKSKKSLVMETVRTGQVVRVIKTGKTWTMIDHDGLRGYVLTGSLSFYANEPREYGTGSISYKGRTTGNATVHIRSAAKNSGRHLAEYAVGTPLTVFEKGDKWCEVDVAGWHCYILTKYVTMDAASAEDPQAGEPG